jgi:hypothetical protein
MPAAVLAALALVASCRSGPETSQEAEANKPSPSPSVFIEINGSVEVGYAANVAIGACTQLIGSNNPVSISLRNEEGDIIGTIQVTLLSGDVPILVPRGRCSGAGSYTIEVPEVAFYQAEVDGRPAGAISLEELEAAEFTFDLSIETA